MVRCFFSFTKRVLFSLRAVPRRFAKWKREAEDWYEKDSVMFEKLFLRVKDDVVSILLGWFLEISCMINSYSAGPWSRPAQSQWYNDEKCCPV
jgi:hypothetical protein